MKAIILLFILVSLSSCVTSGLKARAVASDECNIENYKDFINKPGVHNCNLQWMILRDIDLRGNLRGADLRGADLRGAYLYMADLRDTDLRGARLEGADLQWADLNRADLRGARLEGADLQWADLRGAKVTQKQNEYLKKFGLISGFVVVE